MKLRFPSASLRAHAQSVHRAGSRAAHFVTSSILDWLPVFQTPACCNILVESLAFCQREKGLRLYAWVILDNHFHAVVSSEQWPRVMADLKKSTAGKLTAQIEEERRTWLLDLLVARKAEHKTSSTYQLWQEGYHPQSIYSEEVMLQKINYVHLNPVRRGGVLSPERWGYSSAHEWQPGGMPLLRCDQ